LISYSTRPLQMFGLLGAAMGAIGSLMLAWLTYVKYVQHESIGNRPLLSFGILMLLGGVQLVTTGVVAEMVSRTYHESQDKPTYIIREVRETLVAPGMERRAAQGQSGLAGMAAGRGRAGEHEETGT